MATRPTHHAQAVYQLRQQAHQALQAGLPQWPATLEAAQANTGCRLALSTLVTALLALQPAYPKRTQPAGDALMRLALSPLPTVDRRRAAAGDTDDDTTPEGAAA